MEVGLEVELPCCGEKVKVTKRESKIKERPRNHDCKKCGKGYAIQVRPLVVKERFEPKKKES